MTAFFRLLLAVVLFAEVLPAAEGHLLLVRPDQADFAVAAKAMMAELGERHPIETLIAHGQEGPDPEALTRALDRRPRVIVAFDNRAIAAVRQARGPQGPPVVAAMGLNLAQELDPTAGLCGVSFDVAPFTLVTRFQAITHSRIRSVLLPCRGHAFADQVARDVTAEGDDPQRIAWVLERHLATWVAEEGIDAVVVPSDSVLVNRRTLPLWMKVGRRSSRPFLTGIEALAASNLAFCVFAAAPDPQGVGSQAAQLVLQLIEDPRAAQRLGIEPPIQIRTRWDPAQAERLGLVLHDPSEEVP
jgi:hypothetical protein